MCSFHFLLLFQDLILSYTSYNINTIKYIIFEIFRNILNHNIERERVVISNFDIRLLESRLNYWVLFKFFSFLGVIRQKVCLSYVMVFYKNNTGRN
jgi:hypothetical protein